MRRLNFRLKDTYFLLPIHFMRTEPTIDEIVAVMLDKTQSVIQEYHDTNGRSVHVCSPIIDDGIIN